MRRPIRWVAVATVFASTVASTGVRAAPDPGAPIDGTTAQGDRVRLYPNGRWEYIEAKKADAQRPTIEAYEKERSLEQGGLFGVGRRIQPGDPDYNRGSLGGKSR